MTGNDRFHDFKPDNEAWDLLNKAGCASEWRMSLFKHQYDLTQRRDQPQRWFVLVWVAGVYPLMCVHYRYLFNFSNFSWENGPLLPSFAIFWCLFLYHLGVFKHTQADTHIQTYTLCQQMTGCRSGRSVSWGHWGRTKKNAERNYVC